MGMPYCDNSDLPSPVRPHLPEHARDIDREAFNPAFAAHGGAPGREQAAHRIAWTAVKRSYGRAGSDPRAGIG